MSLRGRGRGSAQPLPPNNRPTKPKEDIFAAIDEGLRITVPNTRGAKSNAGPGRGQAPPQDQALGRVPPQDRLGAKVSAIEEPIEASKRGFKAAFKPIPQSVGSGSRPSGSASGNGSAAPILNPLVDADYGSNDASSESLRITVGNDRFKDTSRPSPMDRLGPPVDHDGKESPHKPSRSSSGSDRHKAASDHHRHSERDRYRERDRGYRDDRRRDDRFRDHNRDRHDDRGRARRSRSRDRGRDRRRRTRSRSRSRSHSPSGRSSRHHGPSYRKPGQDEKYRGSIDPKRPVLVDSKLQPLNASEPPVIDKALYRNSPYQESASSRSSSVDRFRISPERNRGASLERPPIEPSAREDDFFDDLYGTPHPSSSVPKREDNESNTPASHMMDYGHGGPDRNTPDTNYTPSDSYSFNPEDPDLNPAITLPGLGGDDEDMRDGEEPTKPIFPTDTMNIDDEDRFLYGDEEEEEEEKKEEIAVENKPMPVKRKAEPYKSPISPSRMSDPYKSPLSPSRMADPYKSPIPPSRRSEPIPPSRRSEPIPPSRRSERYKPELVAKGLTNPIRAPPDAPPPSKRRYESDVVSPSPREIIHSEPREEERRTRSRSRSNSRDPFPTVPASGRRRTESDEHRSFIDDLIEQTATPEVKERYRRYKNEVSMQNQKGNVESDHTVYDDDVPVRRSAEGYREDHPDHREQRQFGRGPPERSPQPEDRTSRRSRFDHSDKKEEPAQNKKNDFLQDPTISGILKSIGFNFEMSKKMQEQARQREGKKADSPLPNDPSTYGVQQQGASFMGGGLSQVDLGSVFSKTKKTEPAKGENYYKELARRYREEEEKKATVRESPKRDDRSPSPNKISASTEKSVSALDKLQSYDSYDINPPAEQYPRQYEYPNPNQQPGQPQSQPYAYGQYGYHQDPYGPPRGPPMYGAPYGAPQGYGPPPGYGGPQRPRYPPGPGYPPHGPPAGYPPAPQEQAAPAPSFSNLKVIQTTDLADSTPSEKSQRTTGPSRSSNRTVLPPKSTQISHKEGSRERDVKSMPAAPQSRSTARSQEPVVKEEKKKLSQRDRERMLREREERQKRMKALERELERLKKQQNELMRKRQRQKDGHKDPLLIENSKLQDEIGKQISMLRKAVEDNSKDLRSGSFNAKDGEKESEKRERTTGGDEDAKSRHRSRDGSNVFKEKTEHREDLKGEVKKEESKLKIPLKYDYFDPYNHWCRFCNTVSRTFQDSYDHLHSKKHLQLMDHYDRPWVPASLKSPTKKETPSKAHTLCAPYKGAEFLMASRALYCSLCKVFCGDKLCAEDHVKSESHNNKYQKYIEENPFYERRYQLDMVAGNSVRKEKEEKQKLVEERNAADRATAKEERKKAAATAAAAVAALAERDAISKAVAAAKQVEQRLTAQPAEDDPKAKFWKKTSVKKEKSAPSVEVAEEMEEEDEEEDDTLVKPLIKKEKEIVKKEPKAISIKLAHRAPIRKPTIAEKVQRLWGPSPSYRLQKQHKSQEQQQQQPAPAARRSFKPEPKEEKKPQMAPAISLDDFLAIGSGSSGLKSVPVHTEVNKVVDVERAQEMKMLGIEEDPCMLMPLAVPPPTIVHNVSSKATTTMASSSAKDLYGIFLSETTTSTSSSQHNTETASSYLEEPQPPGLDDIQLPPAPNPYAQSLPPVQHSSSTHDEEQVGTQGFGSYTTADSDTAQYSLLTHSLGSATDTVAPTQMTNQEEDDIDDSASDGSGISMHMGSDFEILDECDAE